MNRSLSSRQKIVILFATVWVIAALGAYLLISTKAATLASIGVETESGALSNTCLKKNDATASGGQYIAFQDCTPVATPFKINTWAPQFQGYGTVGPQGDYHPEKFKIVIGTNNIKSIIGTLHNSGAKVLVYVNGTFKNGQDLGPNGNDPTYNTDYPESSYAHTTSGARIVPNAFDANYLMNPSDTIWRNSLYKKCQYFFAQGAYDGCFFDTIGTAPVTASYVSPGLPVNTSTGQVWTQSAWLAAMNANVTNVKNNIPGKLVYGNGLSDGSRYYAATNVLTNSLDAAMAEQFVMPSTSGPTQSEADWKKNVDMLNDAQTKQKPILVQTKAWDSADRQTKDKRHKYALATFLLGVNNYTYFNFQYDHTTTSPSTWHPWWDTDFGSPLASYSKDASGVYIRKFNQAIATVNASPTQTITYQLGGTYHAVDSATPISSVTLGPRTAEIVIK